jgi:chitodextrinase
MVLAPTGQESRPQAATVIWLGPTRPVQMSANDLWFNPSTVDSQAPTVPNGLQATNTTQTSLTLSWNASTDNIAATLYQVYVDGTLTASTASTTAEITGLSPATQYSFTVRAKDDAENWSALSAPLLHTTLSAVTEHTVYGSSVPATLAQANDGGTITVSTAFYVYGAGAEWNSTGARLYVPDGITVPSSAEMYIWTGTDTLITSAPVQTKTLTGITTGWNTVHWNTPVDLTPSVYAWIGYKFANGDYMYATRITEALSTPPGVGEGTDAGDASYPVRSQYAITAGASGRSAFIYGLDIVVA